MALKNEAEKVFDEAILLLIKRAQSRDDWKKYVREENFFNNRNLCLFYNSHYFIFIE